MFHNLEEAIVVSQDRKIDFLNFKFQQLMKRITHNDNITAEEILNLKFLELYRKSDEQEMQGSARIKDQSHGDG